MTANGGFFRPISQEFPQLSRPIHADVYEASTESRQGPKEYEFPGQNVDALNDFEEPGAEEEKTYVNDEDLLQMLRGFVDEVDEKSHGRLKRLFPKVKKDVKVRFERLFRETLQDFRGRPVSDMLEKFISKLNSDTGSDPASRDRGLNGDSEDLSFKLERFKVKTVNVGGIVKEKDKK